MTVQAWYASTCEGCSLNTRASWGCDHQAAPRDIAVNLLQGCALQLPAVVGLSLAQGLREVLRTLQRQSSVLGGHGVYAAITMSTVQTRENVEIWGRKTTQETTGQTDFMLSVNISSAFK